MKQIPIGKRGECALIDDEDYVEMLKYRWYLTRGGYAVSSPKVGLMHRKIMNTPKGMETDHINGNRLDNRKRNLRVCTTRENRRNRATFPNNSGFKGVSRRNDCNRWTAMITTDYKAVYLGLFKTAVEAARAYNDAALKYHGKFARLNDLSPNR